MTVKAQFYVDMLNLAFVQRWNITPMDRPQSVAEHCYRVMVLVDWIMDTICDGDDNLKLVNAFRLAMRHDRDEVYTGDRPSPDKGPVDLPNIASIGLEECVVKTADAMETLLWWNAFGPSANQWPHPWNPAGDRECRKILHYTQKHPDLPLTTGAIWFGLTSESASPWWKLEHKETIFGGR